MKENADDIEYSIITTAYRESNLQRLVHRLLSERTPGYMLERIFIVACDCGDASLIELAKNRKIKIIKEDTRRGKASSINSALAEAGTDIIVMESADTFPRKGTLAALLRPFKDAGVGMATGRPVPTNDKRTFVGFLSHTVWALHHIVSSKSPKGGEIVAFRRLFRRMPTRIVADESYIEFSVRKSGYGIVYAPSAVVYNRGPSSISSFFNQRRRVFSGHVQMTDELGYQVSTMDVQRIVSAILEYAASGGVSDANEALWFMAAILIEACARLAGTYDFRIAKKVPYKWSMTK